MISSGGVLYRAAIVKAGVGSEFVEKLTDLAAGKFGGGLVSGLPCFCLGTIPSVWTTRNHYL